MLRPGGNASAVVNPVNIIFGGLMLAWGLALLAFPQTATGIAGRRTARLLQAEDGTIPSTAVRIAAFFPILAGLLIAHKGLTSPLR